jgi:hypothetical protein
MPQVRDWIVPANRRYPLSELLGTLRELYPAPARKEPAQSPVSREQPLSHWGPDTAQPQTAPTHHSTEQATTQLSSSRAAAAPHTSPSQQVQQSQPLQPEAGQQQQQQHTNRDPVRRQRAFQQQLQSQQGSQEQGSQQGPGTGSTRGVGPGLGSPVHSTLLIQYTMLRGINDTPEDAHR